MDFENKLISGLFIKRYKRFFVNVKINNQVITAHCPNTGSMYGLLNKGSTVWVSKTNNPNRKLKYTLEIIEDQKAKVGVNTHSTNKIVHHSLKNNLINSFFKYSLSIKYLFTKYSDMAFWQDSTGTSANIIVAKQTQHENNPL